GHRSRQPRRWTRCCTSWKVAPLRPRSLCPAVPASLEAVCLKCLAKDPGDRYPSAAALADDLAAFLRGAPVRADGTSYAQLWRLLRRESRHAEVMALWGRVWMWHAVQILVLFLATTLLSAAGVTATGAYALLWGAGLASLAVPPWHYRFRSGLPLAPVEWQCGQVCLLFGAGFLLTGVLANWAGLPALRALPLLVLQAGVGIGCLAVILGGSFYVLAAACVASAVLLAVRPDVGPPIFGVVFAVGLFIPRWKYARARRRPGPRAGGLP